MDWNLQKLLSIDNKVCCSFWFPESEINYILQNSIRMLNTITPEKSKFD